MIKLAKVCVRANVDPQVANKALFEAHPLPARRPWAREVEVDGERYVVGQGNNEEYFVCLPLPFSGHTDDWKMILPIHSAVDLLEQLREV